MAMLQKLAEEHDVRKASTFLFSLGSLDNVVEVFDRSEFDPFGKRPSWH